MMKLLALVTICFASQCVCAPSKARAALPPFAGVPTIDLDAETNRRVIVDRETGQYLGHPTTVLLRDGHTMIAVYPKGHGKGAIQMKRSSDAGRTWSERLPTPASWATSLETPTIHRLIDPGTGRERLVLFSGLYPIRRAYSDDNGEHWSELEPVGEWGGIVGMASVVALHDGRAAAFFHDDGRFLHANGKADGVFRVLMSTSNDGGLTWCLPRELWSGSDVNLCEPGAVRSPDGKTLALLLRENKRAKSSHIMISNDEGATWTTPRELPMALAGDRHVAHYTPDGRLVVTFRDMGFVQGKGADAEHNAPSPTRGDWIVWVGTWTDLVHGSPGEYRVRLADNKDSWDCGYAGLDMLADGTFVATSYGHWDAGQPAYVISERFTMRELDERAAKAGVVMPPSPVGALPSASQLAWHAREFYGFVHFTTNTFTDREWGNGDESPAVFAPTGLDARQWARVARESGMTGLILTAKHHDGFCLWPSSLTEHSVKASPFRDGKGDVVGEFTDACRAEGIAVGLYLSPWDRNHAEYGRPAYVTYYRDQWSELIGRYGPLFELWQDGANGGVGYYGGARENRTIDRTAYYDWPRTNASLMEQNPGVIIFSDAGPGCRWVGNESGVSDEESWQTINAGGMYPGVAHDHLARGDKGGTDWIGVECDVSIRPGWFYHASEDGKVKSAAQLVDLWYASVGRGANLILNVPPDRRGVFHENDVTSLRGMKAILDATFSKNLALGGSARASSVRGGLDRFGAACVLDGDPATSWCTDDGITSGTVEVSLPGESTFNVVRVSEAIALGQRVESFGVDAWLDGGWCRVFTGTTIGPRRVVRFSSVTSDRVRLVIHSALGPPVINELGVYLGPG